MTRTRITGGQPSASDWSSDLDAALSANVEEHLARMEGRYRGLLEAAPDAMVVVNEAGEIVLLNVQAERQFGYRRDELIGQQVTNIIPEGFAERLIADGTRSAAETLAQQIGTGIELVGRRKDGSGFPIEIMLSPLESTEGVLVTAAIRDISVRKAAERRLAQMESRYRGLLEAAPDAMVVVNEHGNIVLLNVQAERQFGYPRNELLGQPVTKIIPEGFAERLIADGLRSDADALAQQIDTGLELVGRRKDGSRTPIEIMLSPLHSAEGLLVTMAVRDITGRILAEHQLRGKMQELLFEKERNRMTTEKLHEDDLRRQKDASDATNASRSAFLAQMSHEIRTPMNGVVGMTELLIDTQLTHEQREYVETIQGSAAALVSLINDILHLSRIESGKMALQEESFSLRATVSAAARVLAVAAAQKSVELVVDIMGGVPDALLGDATRLRQMIVNLVGNAVKFTDRGEIVIKVAMEEESMGRALLRFSVRDTGCGIPPNRIERLFEAFEQLDSSDTRSHGGSGLGLAITRGLAELMGGSVWAVSEVGVGSTFHVTASLRIANPETDSQRRELQGKRILVIDGRSAAREPLRRMLTVHGATVSAFSSCEEVDEIHPSGVLAFDELILDSLTTGSAGIEWAFGRGMCANQIVMLLSAAHLHAGAQQIAPFKIDRYLVKPVAEQKAIDLLLHGSRSVRPQATISPKPVPVSPLHILLVEDNLINQRVASRFLAREGHTTLLASNGQEALDAFRRHSFDVIFMDVQMPKMNGLTATREIRKLEQPLGLHTPIIALTADAADGDRESCLAAGMDGYVSKPITFADLRDAIAVSLAKKTDLELEMDESK